MGNEKTMTCSKKCLDIPVWRRYTLTIEEAAGYYHIGEGKLRMLIDEHPNEDFYVMNGNRALIKREKFERYLDQALLYNNLSKSRWQIAVLSWQSYTESQTCAMISVQVWLSFLLEERFQ